MEVTDPSITKSARRMMIRMIAPVVAVSLLLLTVGVASSWYVLQLQKNASDLLTQDVAIARAAEELVLTINQIEVLIDQFLLTGAKERLNVIPTYREETDRWLGEAERLSVAKWERNVLATIRSAHERFWEGIEGIRRQEEHERIKVGMRAISGLLTTELLHPAREYLDAKEHELGIASGQIQAMPSRVATVLLVLGTCGSLAGLLAGFGIARGISRSIAQLSVPVRDVAGKLSEVVGPITLSPAGDVEGLEVVLRKMAGEVGTVVARLELTRRDALRAEQLAALGQMAAGLAHELRNPLTAMKILVQSATERGDAGGLRGRPLAVLEEEIIRLEKSIQAFLDFARPPALEKRPFDLVRVVDQIEALVSPRAAAKGIAIEREGEPGPITIVADMGQVRQVLLNLLINALDATPEGGMIWIRLSREPHGAADPGASGIGGPAHGGGWLAIRVADSGCGLPDELRDRIYEPFVSTKETGLGLGLSICKRIVEAHGGRIVAADRTGGGTTFTVLFPDLSDGEASSTA